MPTQAVILAAGESSRFWPFNHGHKSQIKLLGRPLIFWTIKALAENNVKDIAIIVSPESALKEELKTASGELGVAALSYFVQEKPLGTGNAISLVKDFIKEPFFILWGAEVSAGETIVKILEKYQSDKPNAVLVGAKTNTPWDYGIFKLAGERILEIVENPKSGQEPSNIKAVGTYFLEPDFFDYYQKLPKHHEADFVDALNLYLKDRKSELVLLEKDTPSLKYPWNLLEIAKIMLETEKENYISSSAVIGKNTVIEGRVYIGDHCEIGSSNVLRGPLNLENGVKTGAFFEIKNSVVQESTHFHSGYVGDSVIGKNCRFGAGFITANRRTDRNSIKATVKKEKIDTGLTYLGAMVGQNTSFGIHSGTMPGVIVGANCSVGPGTLVFENIEDNITFYAKFEKVVKKNEDIKN